MRRARKPQLPGWARRYLRWTPSRRLGQATAAATVGVALVARFGLEAALGASAVPFLPFFPAVLLSAMVGGAWGGLTALGLSIVAAYGTLLAANPASTLTAFVAVRFAIFASSCLMVILIASLARALVVVLADSERQAQLIARETAHRSRNLLSLVQAISLQIARDAPSLEDYQRRFHDRLAALGRAQSIEADETASVDARSLIEAVLSPFGEDRFRLGGPPAAIAVEERSPVALLLHELATNASKYGSLSAPEGCVELRWTQSQEGLRIVWTERDGPHVSPPLRRGFGTRLFEVALSPDRGKARVEYVPSGLRCEIWLRRGEAEG